MKNRYLSKILLFKLAIICLAFAGFLLIPYQLHAARALEIKSKTDLSHKSGKLGPYRALVIGINDYQDKKIPALKTAVNDVKEFANLLQNRYGFKVTMLLDRQATRQAIMDKMRDLAANTLPEESVLIYYAGHGEIDRVLNDGWWVPADAIGGNSSTYVDNMFVQRVMKGMKARHVLLVSDSCYSGTLFGESRSLPPLIDDKYYLNLYNERSREGMTSGNKTPVSDSGSEGHSIFAYQLIKALNKNEKPYITTKELYNQIAPIIANNSEQQPLCSPVRDTGDQGGGFVFVDSRTPSVSDTPFYQKKSQPRPESDELAQQKAALDRERQELARDKQEIEKIEAMQAEQKKLELERNELASKKKQLVAMKQDQAKLSRPTISNKEVAIAQGGDLGDVDINIPEGEKAGRYDVAVIIGNRNYADSGLPNVDFANRDAQVMKEYLIRTMGYNRDQILYAEDATLTRFNEVFGSDRNHKGKLFRYVKEGQSNVFVYYAGHGAPDIETNEGYFMPVDAKTGDMKSSGYSIQTFYDNLAKIPAKKITVVLDASFPNMESHVPTNAVLITSAAVGQVSAWYHAKRHSLFTYYFLKGLQGAADTNLDGRITVGEIDAYLKEQVPYMARRLIGTEQRPVVTGNPVDVIAVLKK